jgi:hypothetical protein
VDIRVSLADVVKRQGGVLATTPEKGRRSRRLHAVHRWFGQEKQFVEENGMSITTHTPVTAHSCDLETRGSVATAWDERIFNYD